MTPRHVISLLSLAAVMTACSEKPAPASSPAAAPPTPPAQVRLRVTFDSGFAFIANADGTVSAVTPKHEMAGMPGMANTHATLTLADAADDTHRADVTGRRLQLPAASGAVALPDATAVATGKGNCPAQPPATDVNRRGYLVNLLALHPGETPNLTASNVSFRTDLGGGQLSIQSTFGCWSIDGGNAWQPLAVGEKSVAYEAMIDADKLSVVLSNLDGTGTTPFVPKIENGRASLRLWYPGLENAPAPKLNERMADFDAYYSLLGRSIPSAKRQAPVYKGGASADGKPGFNCASIFIIPSGAGGQ